MENRRHFRHVENAPSATTTALPTVTGKMCCIPPSSIRGAPPILRWIPLGSSVLAVAPDTSDGRRNSILHLDDERQSG
jgi:hypothetical protein